MPGHQREKRRVCDIEKIQHKLGVNYKVKVGKNTCYSSWKIELISLLSGDCYDHYKFYVTWYSFCISEHQCPCEKFEEVSPLLIPFLLSSIIRSRFWLHLCFLPLGVHRTTCTCSACFLKHIVSKLHQNNMQ